MRVITRTSAMKVVSRRIEALDFIAKAVEVAGYKLGDEVALALDCASTEYFEDGVYHLTGEGRKLGPDEMVDYLAKHCGAEQTSA